VSTSLGIGRDLTVLARLVLQSSTLGLVELDHVLVAVADLAAAAHDFESRYGLVSLEGGTHPGWGTANRIVPLGKTYLELVAVIDPIEAGESTFGQWVSRGASASGRPLGWAVRTRELDSVARRLGLNVTAGSRATPGGAILRWRSAGMDEAAAEPLLPFFIEWDSATEFPGRKAAGDRAGVGRISRLALEGSASRLSAWLGTDLLPISVRAGAPAVASIVLWTADGEVLISDKP
jgi:hypothetical protein